MVFFLVLSGAFDDARVNFARIFIELFIVLVCGMFVRLNMFVCSVCVVYLVRFNFVGGWMDILLYLLECLGVVLYVLGFVNGIKFIVAKLIRIDDFVVCFVM